MGTASGSVTFPILVELASGIKDKLGTIPGASEKASALFTFFAGIGIILSTILGGIFYQLLGNRITCDLFGLLSLSMAIIFFILNIKPGYLIRESNSDTHSPKNSD